MGQPVGVVEKPGSRPGLVRFEANRNLTGTGHERFTSAEAAVGPRPAAVLARRLFATGKVEAVHVYMNVVTVDLRKGFSPDGLKELVEDLYTYYRPGVEVASFEELTAAAEPDAPAVVASGGGDAPAVSEAAKKIPAHLLERSRAALAKAKAG